VFGGGSPLDLFNNKNQAAGSPAGGPNAVLNAPVNNSGLSQVQQAQIKAGTGQGQAGQKQGSLTALAGKVNPNAFNLGINNAGGVSNSSLTPVVAPADTRGIMESFGDVISGDGGRMNAVKQLFLPDAAGNPDMLRKYGPAFLAAIAAGKGLGAFDEAEVDQVEAFGGLTGGGLLAQNPGMYRPGVPSRGYAQGGGISNLGAFPRRNGGISGPGTPTSDEIPAMLSDGEFVMTEAAVRGMGDGNRQRGIQNMYQVMDNLESRVA
jgi:hypothetical protein